MFDDKVIIITGGTGSFGQAMVKELLTNHNPQSIRIYSRGEFLQLEMQQKFNDSRLRFFIGDVRDKDRLHRAMDGVDICIHAAALKQVPTAEYNPIEAVRTNINGAVNVIDVALDNNVEKVIALGSDKEVNAVNLYGATKMVAQKLFIQANAYVGKKRTRFSCTRYGNVIASRGSVIPLFLKQKETGTITITDERMTRFWLTLKQGVKFVIRCIDEMQGGEIFVPKIPSMSLMELADAIAPNAKKKIVGIRPGEKLHEVLLTEEESTHTIEYDDHFVIMPEFHFWDGVNDKLDGVRLSSMRYSSDNNTKWLSKEELKDLIKCVD